MTISKNIIEEIKLLNISDKEKKVLISYLEVEDSGRYRYKKEYDKIVKKFLSNGANKE